MRLRFNLGDLVDRDDGRLDQAAVIDLLGAAPRTVTFRALDAMTAAVARGLLARGLARGDRIALLSANRVEFLAAYLGAMQAGLVAVPINHRFPREMTDFVLRDSGARLVFCDPDRRAACPPGLPAVVFGPSAADAIGDEARNAIAFDALLDPGEFDPVVPAADETAMILYTSGSTGRPKGVVLSHRSHLWVVETRMAGQDLGRHRFLIAAPLYHMNALALAKLTIAASATMVLLPQFSTAAYIDAIEQHRCTWLTAVPPMVAMMLRDSDRMAQTDLSSVEYLRMGSAPVSPALLEAIRSAMPKATVVNAYGSTEAGPVVFGPHPGGLPKPVLSLGYPHPLVHVRLADGDDRNAGQGVLEMKCPALMTGYHNRPDLKPPFTDDGYYISGDVFRCDDDGFHYFVGRTDDMFVCGGENVYPSELERLIETHAAVAQACVLPIDDDIKGQKPVAFCVLRDGAQLNEDDLKRYCLDHAPAYMHPRAVWFIDRLPITTTNKVDRNELAQRAAGARPSSPRQP